MATISNVIDNIKVKYLMLDGGTMTGAIKKGGGYFIENIGKDGALFIANDATHNYTNFGVYGTDHSSYPNVFLVKCGDGTNTKYLMGYPDGKLLWGGRNIVCVESGTSGNFWYRKYADGWIEQGGLLIPSSGDNNYLEVTVTLPIAFSNTNYIVLSTGTYTTHLGSSDAVVTKKTTTQVGIKAHIYKAGVEYATFYCCGR